MSLASFSHLPHFQLTFLSLAWGLFMSKGALSLQRYRTPTNALGVQGSKTFLPWFHIFLGSCTQLLFWFFLSRTLCSPIISHRKCFLSTSLWWSLLSTHLLWIDQYL